MSHHDLQFVADELANDPYIQFDRWYQEEKKTGYDPSPMVVATVDEEGLPDTRVVLLKEYSQKGYVFYTHYNSPKGKQAENVGVVALNFYWPKSNRQIRIKGNIKRISREDSEKYFASRPRESQINTQASTQSAVLKDKNELLGKISTIVRDFAGKEIPCPKLWGGYCVTPYEYEFFQSENYRLNDRVRYRKYEKDGTWIKEELSP